jgi:hypothetical protein
VESGRLREEPSGLTSNKYTVTTPESFYWSNDILSNSWVGKCFTRGQKYLIYVILTSDDKKLSQKLLAKTLNIDVRQVRKMLTEIRKKITIEEI